DRDGRVSVVHVLHELQRSGAETCLAVAGPRWRAAGVDAAALATGPTLGPYAPRLAAAGLRTGHLPLDPITTFAPAFWRLVRRERVDAVHIHVERGNFYLALLAKLAGVPTILCSVHNVFAFTGA